MDEKSNIHSSTCGRGIATLKLLMFEQLQPHHQQSMFSPLLLQSPPSCLAGGTWDFLRLFPDPRAQCSCFPPGCPGLLHTVEISVSQFQKHLFSQAALRPTAHCKFLSCLVAPLCPVLLKGRFCFAKMQSSKMQASQATLLPGNSASSYL